MKSNLKNWRSAVRGMSESSWGSLSARAQSICERSRPGCLSAEQERGGDDVWGLVCGVVAICALDLHGHQPVLDMTGANCGVGQSSGPVFFLAGAATTEPVTRTCTVPAGKVLFFPIINAECSTVEPPPFHGDNAQELRTCVAAFVDGVEKSTLEVTINRKKVRHLDRFRAQSPLFEFIMPAEDNFLGLPGVTSGSSVSDGYWLMVKPLSSGNHVIHFEGAFVAGPGAGFSQDVTYNLTVTP